MADDRQRVGRDGGEQLGDVALLRHGPVVAGASAAGEQDREEEKQGEEAFFAHNLQIY